MEIKESPDIGHIPFRFSHLWIQHQDFMDRVCAAWDSAVSGFPFFVWEEKLRRVKKINKRIDKRFTFFSGGEERSSKAIRQTSIENEKHGNIC